VENVKGSKKGIDDKIKEDARERPSLRNTSFNRDREVKDARVNIIRM